MIENGVEIERTIESVLKDSKILTGRKKISSAELHGVEKNIIDLEN